MSVMDNCELKKSNYLYMNLETVYLFSSNNQVHNWIKYKFWFHKTDNKEFINLDSIRLILVS